MWDVYEEDVPANVVNEIDYEQEMRRAMLLVGGHDLGSLQQEPTPSHDDGKDVDIADSDPIDRKLSPCLRRALQLSRTLSNRRSSR